MSAAVTVIGLGALAAGIVALARRHKGMPEPTVCLPPPPASDDDFPVTNQPVFPDQPPADAPERSPEQLAAALDAAAARHKPPLNWRESIEDLCKAAKQPHDYQARRALWYGDLKKTEHYTGSPAQNIEMHKLVLDKLRDPKFGNLVLR